MSQIGSINHKAKLTEDKVRQIKLDLKDGADLRTLAIKFGVSTKTIWRIRQNKGWNHV